MFLSRAAARLPRVRAQRIALPARRYYSLDQSKFLKVSEEIRDAVATGKPVVALESTIYTHGMYCIISIGWGCTDDSRVSISRERRSGLASRVRGQSQWRCSRDYWNPQWCSSRWSECGRDHRACVDGRDEECAESIPAGSGIHMWIGACLFYCLVMSLTLLGPGWKASSWRYDRFWNHDPGSPGRNSCFRYRRTW